jgi:hypothetical protein
MAQEGRVFHLRESKGAGPVHWLGAGRLDFQAWCGSRSQFRHIVRPGTTEEVTCPKCLKGLERGHPFARAR